MSKIVKLILLTIIFLNGTTELDEEDGGIITTLFSPKGTLESMQDRSVRIKKLVILINTKMNNFYEIYNKTKDFIKNKDCFQLRDAIFILKAESEELSLLSKKSSKKNRALDLKDFQKMIKNLEKDKKKVCIEKYR